MLGFRVRRGRRIISLFGGLVAAVAAVCVVIAGLEGWRTWEARTIAIAVDTVETENLTRSLAQHAHDLMQAADVVLVGVRERVTVDGLSPIAQARLRRRMVQVIDSTPMIHGIFVYDATGGWIVNSLSAARSPLNNSDRDYFQYHRDHDEDRVYFGKPVHSKSDGSWIVTVSRRINAADGTFAGVVLVTISVDALREFYATFHMGGSGVITLATSDGIILARQPNDGTIGVDISRGQVFKEFLPYSPAGNFKTIYVSDGITRLGSYRRVSDYPLVIIGAHGLDDVLLEWRADAGLHLIISIVTVLTLAILGVRFAKQMQKTQRADRRYRLLADNASDVIACVGLDGRRLYLSPAFSTLTGRRIRDGLEQPWQDFVHPDDQGRILNLEARLRTGVGPFACNFRYIRNDGMVRWAEVRVQLMDATEGVEAQFVANLRDITERKLAEDEVIALNRELAILAVTDGLTGLANRRRFDEMLAQEWRRAARERQSLSLMLIDVDHFKLYNDRYGHQQGDACLHTVAAAIAGSARRAGDLAARYGGEEFVTLLPGADAAAAVGLAEDLRAAIQAIGVEHSGNPPHAVVTASVGVATMTPVPDSSGSRPEDLVAAADAALYAAKHSGRNRVVSWTTPPVADTPAPVLQG